MFFKDALNSIDTYFGRQMKYIIGPPIPGGLKVASQAPAPSVAELPELPGGEADGTSASDDIDRIARAMERLPSLGSGLHCPRPVPLLFDCGSAPSCELLTAVFFIEMVVDSSEDFKAAVVSARFPRTAPYTSQLKSVFADQWTLASKVPDAWLRDALAAHYALLTSAASTSKLSEIWGVVAIAYGRPQRPLAARDLDALFQSKGIRVDAAALEAFLRPLAGALIADPTWRAELRASSEFARQHSVCNTAVAKIRKVFAAVQKYASPKDMEALQPVMDDFEREVALHPDHDQTDRGADFLSNNIKAFALVGLEVLSPFGGEVKWGAGKRAMDADLMYAYQARQYFQDLKKRSPDASIDEPHQHPGHATGAGGAGRWRKGFY